ncbi:hypothetical protein BTS2_3363 [Bacillus sp. TS-2]|nr:hypothetical protein BTS2_3363 [Bacillus sp. TS-2]
MKGFVTNFLIIFVSVFTVANIVIFSLEYLKKDSVVLTMIESAKIASVASLDHSSRVKEETTKIDEDDFKMSFEEAFNHNLNIDITINKIDYQFLKNEDNEIRAIRVKVTTTDGEEYQTTLIENLAV